MTPSRPLTQPDGLSSVDTQETCQSVETLYPKTDPMALVLVQKLVQLKLVISHLSDDHYSQKPVGVIPSSIGGHVRHALDHVKALLDARATGLLDYDQRERGTLVETCRTAAFQRISELSNSVLELTTQMLLQPLALSMMIDPASPSVQVPSSLQRELGYVVSHMIHHNAIISAMVTTLGGTLPPGFGFAPSTLAAQNSVATQLAAQPQIQPCARSQS